jgi:hypothetical protein
MKERRRSKLMYRSLKAFLGIAVLSLTLVAGFQVFTPDKACAAPCGYTDQDAIAAIEGEATLDLSGEVTVRSGHSPGLFAWNPPQTFRYAFKFGSITADRIVTYPILAADDTVAMLGTEQTFTATQVIDANLGLFLGHSTSNSIGGTTGFFQQAAIDAGGSAFTLTRYSNNTGQPVIVLGKSRGALDTPGTPVQAGDLIGDIRWAVDDGNDLNSYLAQIRVVTTVTPTGDSVFGDIVLETANAAATAREAFRVTNKGIAIVGNGTVINSVNMTKGLIIDQRASDAILTLKDSVDVAHGLTTGWGIGIDTDTYLTVRKRSASAGGTAIFSIAENVASTATLELIGVGGQPDVTKNNLSVGLINLRVFQHNGANTLSSIAADGNVFTIRAWVGTERTLLILDEDGDLFIDGLATGTFDQHEDWQLLRTWRTAMSPEGSALRETHADLLAEHQDLLVEKGILTVTAEEQEVEPLWNVNSIISLLADAGYQEGLERTELEARIAELERLVTDLQGRLN